jgi:hypothetical protein
MATNNMNRGRINPEAVGENYGQLAIYGGVAVVLTALFVAAMWYGYYNNPINNILGGEDARPLREQVPLEIMPMLPETLEEAYDVYTTGEFARLDAFEMVDEGAGIVRIPVADAQAMMLEEGFPVRSEEAASSEASD